MQLQTLFPVHPRNRTVVHAGPLLSQVENGERALRLYLNVPRERELFLIHHGEESYGELASQAGVADIELEAIDAEADANAATEMAIALGARRLDFTIDQPTIRGPAGQRLREVTLTEAESLAAEPRLRASIRAKLRAGCEALRHGLTRVRIGDPRALIRDRATVIVPDPAVLLHSESEQVDGPRPLAVTASPAPAPARLSVSEASPWRAASVRTRGALAPAA